MGSNDQERKIGVIQQLEEMGALDDPGVVSLLTAWLAVDGSDRELDAAVLDLLMGLEMEDLVAGRVYGLPTAECDGPIRLGTAVEVAGQPPVGLFPVDLTRMVLVVGTHGSGKTSLMRNLFFQIKELYG